MWNSLVVGGLDHDGKPFLGTVGMIGTAYTDDHVATGAIGQQWLAPGRQAMLQKRQTAH